MTNLRVSDHAMVRYLERAGGFDIARLRADIARRVTSTARCLPGSVDIDGLSFIVRDDGNGLVITTVILPNPKPLPKKRRKHRPHEVAE